MISLGAVAAAVGLWLGDRFRSRALVLGGAVLATAVLLAGPAAYTFSTVSKSYSGSIIFAGPSSTGSTSGSGLGSGSAGDANASLVSYLEKNQGSAKYLVAAFGSQSSASIIIASGKPVITIGGFMGSDPAPTLAQFQKMVADGEVKYVLISGNGGGGFGGGGPGGGPGGGSSSISSWVTTNGSAVSSSAIGNSTNGTLYDVSGAA